MKNKEKLRRNLDVWREYKRRLRRCEELISVKRIIIKELRNEEVKFFADPEFENIILLGREIHQLKEERCVLTKKCKFWKGRWKMTASEHSKALYMSNNNNN